ncbi:BNR repeat-containing protein, partial [Novosphingobium sp. 1949]
MTKLFALTLAGAALAGSAVPALCDTGSVSAAVHRPAAAPDGSAAPVPAYHLSAVDQVWSSHKVDFAMASDQHRIFIAYYDANRQLTVASRSRGGKDWVYDKLDSWTGWDSHNYIAMALDSQGQVHVIANMHGDPLVYYRTQDPGDVRTLHRVPVLVDRAVEQHMTYPVFLKNASGELIFKYRDGISGNGNEIYDGYDAATQRWAHLQSQPLVDGQGKRSAYFMGPTRGPDGYFHLAWVWRDTPAAETNHDLSYARSRDLVHWERSDGTALTLPITLSTAEIVDPVPVRGGMINNNTVVGFDDQGR